MGNSGLNREAGNEENRRAGVPEGEREKKG